MPHEFEIRDEIALDASPEQVWEAIATGPGIDSWFMGRNEVEPRQGGSAQTSLAGWTQRSTVTAWEPSKRFAFRGEMDPDGTFHAFEYLVAGRDKGSTVLRLVHNGFLGDDWEAEYDALTKGGRMYLQNLAAYLKHFPGRTSAYNLFAPGPQVADQDRVWAAFTAVLGLTGSVAEGDPVRLAVAGLPPVDGVVQFASRPIYLGVRAGDGLYTFIHGYQDTVVVQCHDFSGTIDPAEAGAAWQSWLTRAFA